MLPNRKEEFINWAKEYFAEHRRNTLLIDQLTGRVRNPTAADFEIRFSYDMGAFFQEDPYMDIYSDHKSHEAVVRLEDLVKFLEDSHVWKKLNFDELRKLLPESILEKVSSDLDKWELRAAEERLKDDSHKKCAITEAIERKEAELKTLYTMLKQWEDKNV